MTKLLNAVLILAGLFVFQYNSEAQKIKLPKIWKFAMGDSLQWASTTYDDKSWGKVEVGSTWKYSGYEPNGFAWYRGKFVVPSSMKSAIDKSGLLRLSLGKIDDADQTFFNGKSIGQTGNFPPSYQGQYDVDRIYFVKSADINWDKENIIAVRVYSPDKNGGMWFGTYNFGPVTLEDYVSIREPENTTREKWPVKLHNRKPVKFEGNLKMEIVDDKKRVVNSQTKNISLDPNDTKEFLFDFFPPKESFLSINFAFTEKESQETVKTSLFYSTLQNVVIPIASAKNPIIENKVKNTFVSGNFENEKIQGVLGKRMDINIEKNLLQINEKHLLDGYLHRPGKQTYVGEHVGKYIEAACHSWRYTRNPKLKVQLDRIVYTLIQTQLEDGYLGTYVPEDYWSAWDVWSHKYNLIGLLSYYNTFGYEPALIASKKMGDLLYKTFGDKPDQLDLMKYSTHGGLAAGSVLDPMVDLYRYTGDQKYLDFCNYILRSFEQESGPKIISTLLTKGRVDAVGNGKAYEMLSCLLGITKMYELTGEDKFLKGVQIAWKDVRDKRMYITGTTSSFEHFKDDGILPAADSDHMGEGCVTTTWLQLNYHLFLISGELQYLDEIERSAYNHLTAAENPQTGCVSYYTPLMSPKPYSCSVTCCMSSIPRGISMIPLFSNGKVKNSPAVLIYETSSYEDIVKTSENKNIKIKIDTKSGFPEKGFGDISITCATPSSFPLSLRVPLWSTNFKATCNGKEFKGNADEYVVIDRKWKTGDLIHVDFDIPVKVLDGGKSYPDHIAFQRGPQVLALDSNLNAGNKMQDLFVRNNQIGLTPAIDKLPASWVGSQVYSIPGFVIDKSKPLVLVPYADASQSGGNISVWIRKK